MLVRRDSLYLIEDVVIELVNGDATVTVAVGVSGLKALNHGLCEDGLFHQAGAFIPFETAALERVLHRVRGCEPQSSTPELQVILHAHMVTRLGCSSGTEGTAVAAVQHDDDAPGSAASNLVAHQVRLDRGGVTELDVGVRRRQKEAPSIVFYPVTGEVQEQGVVGVRPGQELMELAPDLVGGLVDDGDDVEVAAF